MNKCELRKKMRAKRQQLLPAERRKGENRVCERLFEMAEVKNAEAAIVYCSTEEEMGTWRLIEKLIDAGKRVYAPRVNGLMLEMVRVCKDTKFTRGAFGICEPIGQAEQVSNFVCILPCLAAGENGGRVGYGGGYYDRFLQSKQCYKIAICWDFQVLPHLQQEAHDQRMDAIITEKRVIYC